VIQALPRDSLARVVREVLEAPAYDWQANRSLLAWLRGVIVALLGWLDRFADRHPVGYVVFLLALAAVLIGLLVHMGWVLYRALNPTPRPVAAADRRAAEVRNAAWHLAQARHAAAAGRFTEALAHRFLALVLDLERRRVVTAHPSKTPAEYAREARLDPGRRDALRALVGVLYGHVYGGKPAGPDDWERFDAAAGGLAEGRHGAAV
jgi:hypothetical protein